MPAQSARPQPQFRLTYLCVLAALLLAGSLAGAQDYTLTKLPPFSQPVAVNSSGQVIGLTTQTGHDSSFLWTRTGGLQILGDLGGGASRAYAMNDSGAVVGESFLADFALHAFLWTQAGGIQDLGSPQGGNSLATAVNAAGEVTGLCYGPNRSGPHAFYWSSATGAVDLGVTNGNTLSFALAINDSGEIVGYQFGNSGFSAFRWTQATGMQTLADFGLLGGVAYAVNDSGQIAGVAGQHAVLWAPDGTFQELGTLPGDGASSATLINRGGHVAGFSRPSNCCGKQRTFFWDGAGIVDIGLLPKHQNGRSLPAGFNNRDQIVGSNGATYLWGPTIGLLQIPGIILKTPVSHPLNDAGQILGYATGYGSAVLASPTMHVSLNSSQNPSSGGQSVTFTANVNAIVGPPPDGEQVAFKDGSTVLGSGTISNGTASFTTSTLAVGKHSITANYVGDNNYLPNKSAKLIQVVNP
jgi:probable HAF family extracellular repeat protein